MDEISCCCIKQIVYNEEYGIMLKMIMCVISDIFEEVMESQVKGWNVVVKGCGKWVIGCLEGVFDGGQVELVGENLVVVVVDLEKWMWEVVVDLEFEEVV